jgi:hypothetical protein
VFSNLFFITLSNIGKYFPGIHFLKKNYFPANKRGLRKKKVELVKERYVVMTTVSYISLYEKGRKIYGD